MIEAGRAAKKKRLKIDVKLGEGRNLQAIEVMRDTIEVFRKRVKQWVDTRKENSTSAMFCGRAYATFLQ